MQCRPLTAKLQTRRFMRVATVMVILTKADLPSGAAHAWTQVNEKTWARLNTGLQANFSRIWPLSKQRFMVVVGVSFEFGREVTVEALRPAWIATRHHYPFVALAYVEPIESGEASSYIVPTAEEAEAWAASTIYTHPAAEDALRLISEGTIEPANDPYATLHLFQGSGKASQLFLRLCHGWSGADGAFMTLNALLKHLAEPKDLPARWGDEVARLPVSLIEQLGYDSPDHQPPQEALDRIAEQRERLSRFKDYTAYPLPAYPMDPSTKPLAIQHHVQRFSVEDTAAILRGFKALGYKLGDGVMHVACIAFHRSSAQLTGRPPPDNAAALMQVPMSLAKFAPGNTFAVSGSSAPVVAENVKAAAATFDAESGPLSLDIPLVDGLIQRNKGSLLGTQAYKENAKLFMDVRLKYLDAQQQATILGISLMGPLDGSVLEETYGSGQRRITLTDVFMSAKSERQTPSVRIWSFGGRLTLRTVVNKHICNPAVIDAWHQEILSMLDKIAKAAA